MGRLFKALALCHPALPDPAGIRIVTADADPRSPALRIRATASSPAAGGVSDGPYRQPELQPAPAAMSASSVLENRARAARAIGADPAALVGLTQVHGAAAVRVDRAVGARRRARAPTPW